MQKITAKTLFLRHCLTAVFVGTSPRWVWWLSLVLLVGGIFWAYQIYDGSRSFFLRRPDVGATVKALIVASVTIGLFAIVTVRRANELRASTKARWTLLVPPLWLFWFPVLGVMKPVAEEALDSFKRLTHVVAGATVVVAVVVLAVAWWAKFGPDVSSASDKGQRLTQPYDCIGEGNKAMATLDTWPRTAAGEDVFIYVIRRCAENDRAF